jgi:hypothetical protein
MVSDNYTFPYWGALVLRATISDSLINKLLSEGEYAVHLGQDATDKLAGRIQKEYYFKDYQEWFVPHLEKLVSMYSLKVQEENWSGTTTAKFPLVIKDVTLWINYQRAGEYNPPHNHTGDLSFIIYLKIPQEILEEPHPPNYTQELNGSINIMNSSDTRPFSKNQLTEVPSDGDVYIFPSWMLHYVHAFKSDVERISVAGNIRLEEL